MSSSLLLAVLAAACLSGCVVGPSYRRPNVELVQKYRLQVGPAEAQSIADLPWWQIFKDKALQSLVSQALTRNYDLQSAVARVEQAQQHVRIARADLFPQIGYDVFGGREKAFVPLPQVQTTNLSYNAFGVVANAAWEPDLWGRIRRSSEAARANLFAQEYVRRGVMLSLVSNVAADYFLLLGLDRQLAVAQESAKTYKQNVELFTLRFHAGRDTKLAVDRAQGAYDSSLANMASLRRAIMQLENALSVLVGEYPRQIQTGAALGEQVMPPTPLGLTTRIIARRPDILAAEQVMIGANAQIGVAVANFFPRIGLSVLFGGQGQTVGDIVNSDFNVWNIIGSITGPIFQGGRLKAAYHAQQAFWDESIAQYKGTILTAFQEVSDALAAQQTLVHQRAALDDQVKVLREAVGLALDRYSGGRASYFEVLDAEAQLFPAEQALAVTRQDQLLSVVDLYQALGGGWNLQDGQWAHEVPRS